MEPLNAPLYHTMFNNNNHCYFKYITRVYVTYSHWQGYQSQRECHIEVDETVDKVETQRLRTYDDIETKLH